MQKSEKLFKELATEWLDYKSKSVKITTSSYYERILEKHFIPEFGDRYVSDIDNADIENYLNEMAVVYKYHTVDSFYIILRSIFMYSGRNFTVKMKDIKIRKQRKIIEALTEKECIRVNKSLQNSDDLKDLGILIALNAGARLGEICGIRWEDIDLEKRSIFIRHNVQRIPSNGENGHKTKLELLNPKSDNSVREVAIPEFLYRKLKRIQKSISSYKVFLLTGSVEKLMDPRVLERHFEYLCIETIGRHVKFHDLRHTFATLSISNGVDVKTVSEILGHANVETTLSFYRNVSFADKYNGVRALEGVIGV